MSSGSYGRPKRQDTIESTVWNVLTFPTQLSSTDLFLRPEWRRLIGL